MTIDELIAVLEKVRGERGNIAVEILDADTDYVLSIEKVGFTDDNRLVVWGWYVNGRGGDEDEITTILWLRNP